MASELKGAPATGSANVAPIAVLIMAYQDEGSDQFSRKRANRIVTDPVPMQTRGNPDATLTPGY